MDTERAARRLRKIADFIEEECVTDVILGKKDVQLAIHLACDGVSIAARMVNIPVTIHSRGIVQEFEVPSVVPGFAPVHITLTARAFESGRTE